MRIWRAVYWLRSARRYYLRYAEVTRSPVPDGTRIRWAATWDMTIAGRIVERGLRSTYPQIVADLAVAAERLDAARQAWR